MATLCKVVFELGVCKFAGLSEATECSLNFDADVAVRCNLVFELVLINDLLGDVFQGHLHEFWPVERSVQMHIRDIDGEAFALWIGEDMVPVELDCFNVGSFCGDSAGTVFDKVTTDSDPCSFWIIFLWSNGADHLGVGDCATFGDLMFVDEHHGVGSFDSVSHALC